ncbi:MULTISPECIES: DUF441 domain-containing protein [unclassified Enterococcus]|uniref:DUF441 domain-containing protein n=1 Tax=unclassified Enterococcus TaxID=2608891 RepID=UPI0013ED6D58|nr:MULTISPECIES: DUF441 domain-containing protein [unclassified Enterococcus]
MESWLFLGLILLVAFLAKNQSLLIATAFVLFVKLIPASKTFFPWLQGKGIKITAAILIPIATGEIGLKDLMDAFKSPMGWIAIFCGGLVAVLSSKGVGLIATDPQITVALVFGTILGVVFLKGIAAGPVIASGIAYCIMQLFSFGK